MAMAQVSLEDPPAERSTDFRLPRLRHIPTTGRRNSELGRECLHLVGEAGLVLDEWEAYVLQHSLRMRPDGRWAAMEVGLCVPRQNGKGPYALDMELLTTDGWTTMGEVRVGQRVYGSDGRSTRVVAKSEVFLGERCFEVEFTDGSKHVVGAEHLWQVWDTAGRGAWINMPTAAIAESRWGYRRKDTGRMTFRYRVRCDIVPQTAAAELPIDPYILGLWLGDGKSTGAVLAVGAEDREYMHAALGDAGLAIAAEGRGNAKWRPFHIGFRLGPKWNHDGFSPRLRKLGVLGNKRIPDLYLTASPEQRLALLQGLMDTDGSIASTNASPQVEFSTSIPALAEDFHRLARSLGIRVTPKWRSTSHRDNCRFLWTPSFNPFRLPRKAAVYRPPRSERHRLMSIVGVREVPSVPVQCIQVTAKDGIYLAGHTFVPTHNSILEARELIGLFIDAEKWPGVVSRLTIHSAHNADTAGEHFLRLTDLIENTYSLRVRLKKTGGLVHGAGGQGISLRDGRRVRFRTRTKGGGRGFSCDLLALDEAMTLPDAMHRAILSTLSARPNPQIWYTGSAVDQQNEEEGVVFSRVRHRGIEGADDALMYAEYSIEAENPEAVTPEMATDEALWEQANPGVGIRISPEFIRLEQRSLGHRSFAVERLGVGDWPDPEESGRVIDPAAWRDCEDRNSRAEDPICLSFVVTPDRARACVAAAGWREDGLAHVEVIEHGRGTDWVGQVLADVSVKSRPLAIVCNGRASEALLARMKEDHSLREAPSKGHPRGGIVPMTSAEEQRGCGILFDTVAERGLRHLGDAKLTAAVAGALKRALVNGWVWDWKSGAEISPLVACTIALWGLHEHARRGAEVISMSDVYDESRAEPGKPTHAGLPPLAPEDLE